jgi:hypothetical protein
VKDQGLIREQTGGHHGQCRILGARDSNLSLEANTPLDLETIHRQAPRAAHSWGVSVFMERA